MCLRALARRGAGKIKNLFPHFGSQKARDAYNNLYRAYQKAGYTEEQTAAVLQAEIPDNAYFNALGIYNYHGGGSVVFDDEKVLRWILSHQKS